MSVRLQRVGICRKARDFEWPAHDGRGKGLRLISLRGPKEHEMGILENLMP